MSAIDKALLDSCIDILLSMVVMVVFVMMMMMDDKIGEGLTELYRE